MSRKKERKADRGLFSAELMKRAVEEVEKKRVVQVVATIAIYVKDPLEQGKRSTIRRSMLSFS